MKKFYPVTILAVFILFFSSCSASNPFARKVYEEQKKGRDLSNKLFIVKKDGEKITAKRLQYQTRTSFFPTSYVNDKAVSADGKKINSGDYVAIQTAYAYKILYYPENSDQSSTGVYINRLRFGKINLYHYEYTARVKNNWQRKKIHHQYLFQTDNNTVQQLDAKNFKMALKNNQLAYDKFEQFFPSGEIPETEPKKTLKCLLEVVDCYNQTSGDYLQVSR